MPTNLIDISIFMPIYNGSKYLCESIESVLNQTFKNFELVCVDDSSTDTSYEILKSFEKKDSRIKLLQKPNGGTVPKSWNYAMPFFKGDFIMYMSQDDLMSIDNLEKLLSRQEKTNADCVLPDMVFYYDDKPNDTGRFGVNGDRNIILSNKEAVKLSLNWRIHGFALWKSAIVKNDYFPEDSFDSDEYMVRKFFYKCNKIVFCEGIFYYRQDNDQAITKLLDKKQYFSLLRDYKIYLLLRDNNFNKEIVENYFFGLVSKFRIKYRMFLDGKEILLKRDYIDVSKMLKEIFKMLSIEKGLYSEQSFYEAIGKKSFILFSNYNLFHLYMRIISIIKTFK